MDRFGNPTPDIEVTYAPSPGSGTADPPVSRTDHTGLMGTYWTFGNLVGLQSLEFRVPGLSPTVLARTFDLDEILRGHYVGTRVVTRQDGVHDPGACSGPVVMGVGANFGVSISTADGNGYWGPLVDGCFDIGVFVGCFTVDATGNASGTGRVSWPSTGCEGAWVVTRVSTALSPGG